MQNFSTFHRCIPKILYNTGLLAHRKSIVNWNSRDSCWQVQITPSRCWKLTGIGVANFPYQNHKICFVVTFNAEFSQVCTNIISKQTKENLNYLQYNCNALNHQLKCLSLFSFQMLGSNFYVIQTTRKFYNYMCIYFQDCIWFDVNLFVCLMLSLYSSIIKSSGIKRLLSAMKNIVQINV
jgi:hypothetical protein